MTKFFNSIFFTAIASLILAACSNSNSWTVEGAIEGADSADLILEASNNGRWYPVDTVALPASGNFSFTRPAAGYPDIYRLRLGNRVLYFPIDSIETISVMARADAFDSEYTLSGSPAAEELMAIDRRLNDAATTLGADIATDSVLKRELGNRLLGDPSGIVAYYIINKQIGGRALFDPNNKLDLRVIGAVANAFNERRPSDPRTAYLTRLYTSRRTAMTPSSSPSDTIVAPAIGVLDISLLDETGTRHSLADLATKGHPIILNFTIYSAEGSQIINLALNKAYEQYRNAGLEIYQVGLDADEYTWQQSARNLPWITVYNSPADGTANLVKYNVTSIPATFIISRDGEIKARIDDIDNLSAEIAPYL